MSFYTKGQNTPTQRQCIKCKQIRPLTAQFWDKSVFGTWFIYCKICFIMTHTSNCKTCLKK